MRDSTSRRSSDQSHYRGMIGHLVFQKILIKMQHKQMFLKCDLYYCLEAKIFSGTTRSQPLMEVNGNMGGT